MSKPLYPASKHDSPHARLYDRDLAHPAWIALSGNAFKLIVWLLAKWRPGKTNSFPVGGATVGKLIGVDRKTGFRAVDELIDAGHLRVERSGRNHGMVKTRERIVSLTRYDTETCAGNKRLPIEVWQKKMNEAELDVREGKNAPSQKSDIG